MVTTGVTLFQVLGCIPQYLEKGPVLLLQNLGYRGSVDSSQIGWLAPAPGVTDAVYSVPGSTQTWV